MVWLPAGNGTGGHQPSDEQVAPTPQSASVWQLATSVCPAQALLSFGMFSAAMLGLALRT